MLEPQNLPKRLTNQTNCCVAPACIHLQKILELERCTVFSIWERNASTSDGNSSGPVFVKSRICPDWYGQFSAVVIFSAIWNLENLYDQIIAEQEAKKATSFPDQPYSITEQPDGVDLIEMHYKYDR